jgi:Superfamily I DNA and RNA helicases
MPTVEDLVGAAPNAHGVLIAGPGAGKSYNIGQRVDSLRSQGIETDDIVLLTLTNATARTLRDRFPAVPVRTVHTYTLTALARLGAVAGRRVADRWEQREFVRRDIQRIAAEGGHTYRIDIVDDFLTAYGTGFRDEPLAEPVLTEDEAILRAAWERVSEFLLLHVFDDFAPELEQLLREGLHIPNPPRAVVVDEYQDLTAVELRLIQMISAEGDAGVFACGDDMQSIYGFRDAAVGGLAAFPGQYSIEGPAYLSESRRCPKPVIDLAEEVVERMPGRAGLAARPRMTSLDDRDGEVRILTFPSHVAETRWVARDIARRRQETPDEKVAVIVPAAIRLYVQAFDAASEHYGLGLTFADSRTRLPLENDEGFRFAYAVLRLASNQDDQLAWRTILHLVPRQPSDRITGLYNSGDTPLTVALRARAPLDRSLASLVDRVVVTYESVRSAGTRDEVMAAIDEAARDFRVPAVPWDALLVVLEEPMAAEEESAPDETAPEHARELLTAGRRAVNRVAADLEPAETQVFVYTIFQAKGQEWDHVYLAGAYRRGFRDQHNRLGEGTRLLYVALTRAGKSLTISKFNSTARRAALIAATGIANPAFPPVLVEAAAAAGVPIEALGPQP